MATARQQQRKSRQGRPGHRPGRRRRVRGGHLPEIYNASASCRRQGGGEKIDVVAEVEQHLGENRVRAVAMKPTDGMQRGMRRSTPARRSRCRSARDARPRAERARRAGRLPGSAGEVEGALADSPPAPTLEQQSTELKMFETGIKVIDLLEPYLQGGKIGLFGGAGVGKTVIIMELITTSP
jgi:F-type H+-transporting ATPase subunit beta